MLFFILLSIILFFFCLYLYFDNKKLKQKINDLELETKRILERKLINNKEDLISIENISIIPKSKPVKEKNNSPEESKITKKDQAEKQTPIPEPTKKSIDKKYTARTTDEEYKKPKIQNPTTSTLTQSLAKNADPEKTPNTKTIPRPSSYPKNNNSNQKATNNNISLSENFNPTEFIKKDKKDVSTNINEPNQDNEYLKEIAKQLEDELTPKTIELTDYEKRQEEQAVISYQELLSLKEKIKNQDKQDKNFLEDLKELRKLLD